MIKVVTYAAVVWTTRGWCYSIALEAEPLLQLSYTSLEWSIVWILIDIHSNINPNLIIQVRILFKLNYFLLKLWVQISLKMFLLKIIFLSLLLLSIDPLHTGLIH